MSERLVLREKKPCGVRGRPKFVYRLNRTNSSKAEFQPSIAAIEFPNLRKACKYEKGGYCKLVKDACKNPKLQTHNKAKIKPFLSILV